MWHLVFFENGQRGLRLMGTNEVLKETQISPALFESLLDSLVGDEANAPLS